MLDAAPCLPNADAVNRVPSSLPYFNLGRLRDEAVRQALEVTRGHKGRAAKLLGVHPNTLTRLLAQPPASVSNSEASPLVAASAQAQSDEKQAIDCHAADGI